MDPKEISEITVNRLAKWSAILIENHATPVIMIGVSHDHRSGELHVLIPEDRTDDEACRLMANAIIKLKGWR